MKVPLTYGWLDEHKLLERALDILGYTTASWLKSEIGVVIAKETRSGVTTTLEFTGVLWTDHAEFTIQQLLHMRVFQIL